MFIFQIEGLGSENHKNPFSSTWNFSGISVSEVWTLTIAPSCLCTGWLLITPPCPHYTSSLQPPISMLLIFCLMVYHVCFALSLLKDSGRYEAVKLATHYLLGGRGGRLCCKSSYINILTVMFCHINIRMRP